MYVDIKACDGVCIKALRKKLVTCPPKSLLIYSMPLIVSVFQRKSIKKHKIHPKRTPFIHQQCQIDVVRAGSVTLSPANCWKPICFITFLRNLSLIQSIKAVLQISPDSTPSTAWSIFILLIRPLPPHFSIAKFTLYRIFLWNICHKNPLLPLWRAQAAALAVTESFGEDKTCFSSKQNCLNVIYFHAPKKIYCEVQHWFRT